MMVSHNGCVDAAGLAAATAAAGVHAVAVQLRRGTCEAATGLPLALRHQPLWRTLRLLSSAAVVVEEEGAGQKSCW